MFDRNTPCNDLPPRPPTAEMESKAILKKAIAASRALAELKGMAERMPNQAMLIDSLVLQEARASSEIENILTTNDKFVCTTCPSQDTDCRKGAPPCHC